MNGQVNKRGKKQETEGGKAHEGDGAARGDKSWGGG